MSVLLNLRGGGKKPNTRQRKTAKAKAEAKAAADEEQVKDFWSLSSDLNKAIIAEIG